VGGGCEKNRKKKKIGGKRSLLSEGLGRMGVCQEGGLKGRQNFNPIQLSQTRGGGKI